MGKEKKIKEKNKNNFIEVIEVLKIMDKGRVYLYDGIDLFVKVAEKNWLKENLS